MNKEELKRITRCKICGKKGHWAEDCSAAPTKRSPEKGVPAAAFCYVAGVPASSWTTTTSSSSNFCYLSLSLRERTTHPSLLTFLPELLGILKGLAKRTGRLLKSHHHSVRRRRSGHWSDPGPDLGDCLQGSVRALGQLGTPDVPVLQLEAEPRSRKWSLFPFLHHATSATRCSAMTVLAEDIPPLLSLEHLGAQIDDRPQDLGDRRCEFADGEVIVRPSHYSFGRVGAGPTLPSSVGDQAPLRS